MVQSLLGLMDQSIYLNWPLFFNWLKLRNFYTAHNCRHLSSMIKSSPFLHQNGIKWIKRVFFYLFKHRSWSWSQPPSLEVLWDWICTESGDTDTIGRLWLQNYGGFFDTLHTRQASNSVVTCRNRDRANRPPSFDRMFWGEICIWWLRYRHNWYTELRRIVWCVIRQASSSVGTCSSRNFWFNLE